jgi:nucleotide-binding universal stress UspA family protein
VGHAGAVQPAGGTPLNLDHVLLPLDGSSFAAAALPTALALADRFAAELLTISVESDERAAARLRASVAKSLGDNVSTIGLDVVVADEPAGAIVARARELGSCVVCMSTRGRGRVAGTMIGSVTRAVLGQSESTVVAVGPQADRPPALVGRPRRRPASWPAPLSIGRLVACVDGTGDSETVLPEASLWALALGMRLSIVTIVDEAANVAGVESSSLFGPPDPRAYVDDLATHWRAVVPDTAGEVVWDPIGVASGLRAHLASRPAGLVAVTTHARSGLERLRLGATAAHIVRTSTAPTLVVPLVER